MNDKELWVCPNCASTSWEPADTTSMQCQCQYYPPVWTSMVQDWHRAPGGWVSVGRELLSVCERMLATVGSGSDLDWHLRTEGYADELRNVVNRAKAAGLG